MNGFGLPVGYRSRSDPVPTVTTNVVRQASVAAKPGSAGIPPAPPFRRYSPLLPSEVDKK